MVSTKEDALVSILSDKATDLINTLEYRVLSNNLSLVQALIKAYSTGLRDGLKTHNLVDKE